jgi:hypothetical protein
MPTGALPAKLTLASAVAGVSDPEPPAGLPLAPPMGESGGENSVSWAWPGIAPLGEIGSSGGEVGCVSASSWATSVSGGMGGSRTGAVPSLGGSAARPGARRAARGSG